MFLIRKQIANPYRGLSLSNLLDLATNSKPLPGLILCGIEYLSDWLKSSDEEKTNKPDMCIAVYGKIIGTEIMNTD